MSARKDSSLRRKLELRDGKEPRTVESTWGRRGRSRSRSGVSRSGGRGTRSGSRGRRSNRERTDSSGSGLVVREAKPRSKSPAGKRSWRSERNIRYSLGIF